MKNLQPHLPCNTKHTFYNKRTRRQPPLSNQAVLLPISTHHLPHDLNFLYWAWLHWPLLLGYSLHRSILSCSGRGLGVEGRKGVPGGWFSLSQLARFGASFGYTAHYRWRRYAHPSIIWCRNIYNSILIKKMILYLQPQGIHPLYMINWQWCYNC